ncbi:serine/threonine-protein kinase [Planktothrix agardhii 1029]|uniref:serine/threonine-protein kinase n=1 Tax=Planktothrix agardhii TaxID=1160 RepID=UPI001D0AEE10|nr:serine/threonine-protein kinase [Planktothrix agardhii]MCB8765466.1 serine/threonine-protein kinase [Planktothrix agardhii 1809]MCB8779102.1 serine/threonine-protein kinase [Planktothrix agardhii 1031]MCB8783519.1 serine/threonine-protein kinase [Planktothrix agardhii 1808]MCF3565454.1 serine/threonine-protein kinase [Planktothrix agardhii 1807]MCF3592030.1 serine/threonine-protein kinase [Planktothrix agardhii 1029]
MSWTPGYQLRQRPYIIETILGQGGFGITYKAKHLQLDHQVVLKTPNAGLQNDPEYPKYVQRFIQEGKTLAKFCKNFHPNIVRVSDLFEENGLHCLVMDLIVGQSLWEFVQNNGRLSEADAVNIIRQIADALVMVHNAGIIHRDAHPGNIMLRNNTSGVLIDFGLAAEIKPQILTSKHLAHVNFAPYEQLRGSGKPTVDVYCLAASLYYAITGQLPTQALDRKLYNQPLISPNEIVEISIHINDAIVTGLGLEPEERPQTMAEFLRLLDIQPQPVQIPQPDIELKSAKGVNYRQLEQLLKAGSWKEADQETANKMYEVAGRTKEGYLRVEDINKFPCEDLRTIDQLWVKYSNERFGFSVQKRIYQSLGGTRSYDSKVWEAFGDQVGWRVGGSWLYYNNLKFNQTAPEGHLPLINPELVGWLAGMWEDRVGIFCRVETVECNDIQPQPVQTPQPNIELKSAKGVNYRQLEQLLKAGNWKEADEETANKMREVAGRTKEGWLRDEDIDNFPCEDLRTIDQLWVKYSNGRFGFSVQKRIYKSLGGTRSYDEKVSEAFGDQVGWRVGGRWLYNIGWKYNIDQKFNLAPVGYLPMAGAWDDCIFSRVETCRL